MSKKIKPPNQASKTPLVLFIVFILVACSAIGAAYVIGNKKKSEPFSDWKISQEVPENLTMKYVPEGDQGAYIKFSTNPEVKNNMDLYSDPRCPVCANLEERVGSNITHSVASGETDLNVHLLTFLDQMTSSTYSTLMVSTLNALASSGDTANTWRLYQSMWANQPSERATGDAVPDREDIADVLTGMDVDPKVVDSVRNADLNFYATGVKSDQENTRVLKEVNGGKVSTPVMVVNGEKVADPFNSGNWGV